MTNRAGGQERASLFVMIDFQSTFHRIQRVHCRVAVSVLSQGGPRASFLGFRGLVKL